ncbi:MAG: hypothetical protein AAGI11_23215 [Pseudomonadota bacterium]
MKTFALAALIALGAAAPTLAQSQLERAIGADAGEFTLSQQVQILGQSDSDNFNERTAFFGNERINFSASNIHNSAAQDVFDNVVAPLLTENH